MIISASGDLFVTSGQRILKYEQLIVKKWVWRVHINSGGSVRSRNLIWRWAGNRRKIDKVANGQKSLNACDCPQIMNYYH